MKVPQFITTPCHTALCDTLSFIPVKFKIIWKLFIVKFINDFLREREKKSLDSHIEDKLEDFFYKKNL